MPFIDVDGVAISYQRFGEGVPVVLTPGGWVCRNGTINFLAGALAAHYSVLVWEKRNGQGASEIALSDSPSEWFDWADDLHDLLHALDLSPAYLYGASAGHVLSLLMAHRHPGDVRGLILRGTPTDNVELLGQLASGHYLRLAEIASSRGMQAVIDSSVSSWIAEISGIPDGHDPWGLQKWIAESIFLNPSNRDRLLSLDSDKFASTLRRWADWFVSDRTYASNLADQELRSVSCPITFIPGNDQWHPRRTADKLRAVFPSSETVIMEERYGASQLEEAAQDSTGTVAGSLMYPVILEVFTRMGA